MIFSRLFFAIIICFVLGFSGNAQSTEITHAMGITSVPDTPKRIVVLTNEGTEAVLSLGITPVGASQSWSGDPWYDHVADALSKTENLGKESAINIELVAAMKPDLILGNKMRHEKIYSQLSSIAPTVLSERLRGDWQRNLKLYAKALGKQKKGEEVLADFERLTGKLSTKLANNLKEKVSVVRFYSSHARIYQLDSFSGMILKKLGFDRPDNQNVNSFVLKVGKESVPDMDGDRIFYFTFDRETEESRKTELDYLNDPIWKGLSAVKAGKAHSVSDIVWNTAGGILAARLMIEDIAHIYGVDGSSK